LAYLLLLVLLYIVIALFSSVTLISFLYFHLSLAVILFANYQQRWSIPIIFILLIVYDATVGVNVGFSLLGFTVSAFILSVVNKFLPLFKQQPFILGRVLWILLSSLIYLALNGFTNQYGAFMAAQLSNILIVLALTIFLEPLLKRSTRGEISLT
jgi:hypothetical protein